MPRERKQVERFKATPVVQPRNRNKQVQQPQQPQQQAPPKRTLDLTLKKVEADLYDTADPESEFYEKYFTNPDDDITQRLDNLDYSKHKHTVSLMSGLTNFELKNIDTIKLKSLSFEKFEKGDYETEKSKSDDKYATKIKGFISKFPSFRKYKDEDDMHWIVRENRLLLTELLEYAIPRNLSLSSIESEVNAMMRVMFLSVGTKLHPLYIKYQAILQEMRYDVKKSEGNNTLNPVELKKGGLIPWPQVLDRQRELFQRFQGISNKQSKDAYALNQDLLLISLYTLIPPLRNEIKTLKYTETKQDKGDFILFEDNEVYLDLMEEKKKHDSIKLKLPLELKHIVLQSYRLYPRQYVFTNTLKYPDFTSKASLNTMNQRLQNLFTGNYKVGISMLRSSFITHTFNAKKLTYNQKEELARQMRTSREMFDLNYYKILTEPMPAVVIDEKIERAIATSAKGVPVVGKMPIPITKTPVLIVNKCTRPREDDHDTYARHLLRQSEYYKENKNEILAKQKQYRQAHKMEMNKRKILSYLNGSKIYKARQTTLDKYGIKVIDGKYV